MRNVIFYVAIPKEWDLLDTLMSIFEHNTQNYTRTTLFNVETSPVGPQSQVDCSSPLPALHIEWSE
jgi:hypothetical protein